MHCHKTSEPLSAHIELLLHVVST